MLSIISNPAIIKFRSTSQETLHMGHMAKKFNYETNISEEFRFLIKCCKTEPSDDDIKEIHSYFMSPNLDINILINSANQHGILPLVYKTLKVLHIDNPLYINLLMNLKTIYTQIAQRNILMSAELIKLINLLEEHDIDTLSFKGPTLSQMAYGDITLRQFGDLDILIGKKDRYKMMDLLIQEHYLPEIDIKEQTKETFFNHVNVIGFLKSSTGVRVEVHWELLSKNYAIDWKEKSYWDKQESVYINNKEVPVLPIEQLFLYLCAHGAKHLFERLEWICDIDRSIKAYPDINWQYLLNEAEKLGIKRMLLLGLALSHEFFKVEIPLMITKEMEKDEALPKLISKIIETNFSNSFQRGKSYSSFGLLLSMRENFSDKLIFTWRGLFTPKFDDFLYMQLPKYLVFFYPFVRPYRLIKKYFKN